MENKETFILPEKWCVKITKENLKQLEIWRGNTNISTAGGDKYSGYLRYDKIWVNGIIDSMEITFKQFQQYVLKEPIMEKIPITRVNLSRIREIACSTWKDKIDIIAKRDLYSADIELTQSEINEMFAAATYDQKPLLVEIFGEQSTKLNFTGTGINRKVDGIDIFGDTEFSIRSAFITLPYYSGEEDMFFLNPDYDWELTPPLPGAAAPRLKVIMKK